MPRTSIRLAHMAVLARALSLAQATRRRGDRCRSLLSRLERAHGRDRTYPILVRLPLHHQSRFIGAPVLDLFQRPYRQSEPFALA
jgi:hypothetical protein